ncbi:MAG TPA: TadE family protein [Candidatus Dormibacteraeota bacterium]|nr:TadE family protein [Candidatus Dormibacteraeota bacterium]
MHSKRGQSIVEVAICLPVLLLLSLGVIDVGRAFYYREAMTNATRQALRMAVSSYQQSTANTACAGSGASPSVVTQSSAIPPSAGNLLTIANQAAMESSATGTPAGSAISGATMTVTFHCLSGAGITNATGNGGLPSSAGSDSITISISYSFQIVTPPLWPFVGTSISFTETESQRTEY